MTQGKRKRSSHVVLQTSPEEEVQNLLEMFEFFLTERSLDRPVALLGEVIGDVRVIIGRLLSNHFLNFSPEQEAHFCAALATLLTDRAWKLPLTTEQDADYIDYFVSEILLAFEWAQEVKAEYSHDPNMKKMVAEDIPVLRPFDYGLKGRMRLVLSDEAKRERRQLHPLAKKFTEK